MAEDIKKNEELKDEDLDFVAGGKYSYDEWKAMTMQQRAEAQARSRIARQQGEHCEMD